MALRPAPQLELRPLRELTNRVVTCVVSAQRGRAPGVRPMPAPVHPLVGRKPARTPTRPVRALPISSHHSSRRSLVASSAHALVCLNALPHRPPGGPGPPPTYSSSTQLFNWDTSNKGCGTAPLRLPYRFKMSCNWAVKFKRAGVKGDFVALASCGPWFGGSFAWRRRDRPIR